MFCSFPSAFLLTSLTLPLTSSKSSGTWSSQKGLQLRKHKITFLSPGSSQEEIKALRDFPPPPFFFCCCCFSLLQSKQINKPGAGLKFLEGSSLSPGHGLLIFAAVLIAVNGFPFSYALQTPLQAALCGLCKGFPLHKKANNKINRKTCPAHCTSGVSQPIAWHAGMPKAQPRIPPRRPLKGVWDGTRNGWRSQQLFEEPLTLGKAHPT